MFQLLIINKMELWSHRLELTVNSRSNICALYCLQVYFYVLVLQEALEESDDSDDEDL